MDLQVTCATVLTFFCLLQGASSETAKQDLNLETVGGNADGANCHFPFVYNMEPHWTCIDAQDNADKPWCASTINFDQDTIFGHCRPKDCAMGSNKAAYGGDTAVTKTGQVCDDWATSPTGSTLDEHFFDSEYSIEEIANHCRNPTNDALLGLHCYTSGVKEACEVPTCEDCNVNLILSYGTSVLSASTVKAPEGGKNYTLAGAMFAKMATEETYGAWCADIPDEDQWIQVEVTEVHLILGLVLQGSPDNQSWVTELKVNHSLDGLGWSTVQENGIDKVFLGSFDQNTPVGYLFADVIHARFIRLLPVSWNNDICLRFEIGGCVDDNDCEVNPCLNQGTCMDLVNDYKCMCPPQWTGDTCQLDYNECPDEPCENGGTCINEEPGFTCSCGGVYSGDTCQHGWDIHCEAIARSGLNKTGYYTVNLYNDTSPCIMVKEMYEVINTGMSPYASLYLAESDCYEACLNDTSCFSVDTTVGDDCFLYNNTGRTREGLGYHASKQCSVAGKVLCDMSTPGWPETKVGHNRMEETIDGVRGSREHITTVNYWPFTDTQIQRLMDDSYSCYQSLTWRCFNSDNNYAGVGFNDELKRMYKYSSSECRCLLGCEVSETDCNCSSPLPDTWQQDMGTFTERAELPVRAILGGDTFDDDELVMYELGPITCIQASFEVDECESQPCNNGGTCYEARYYFNCTCPPGYTGTVCDINIDDCVDSPCENGATCEDRVNGYVCQCDDGYTGQHCETDIYECVSNPCYNNASCVDGKDHWQCLCWPGFVGTQCEMEVNECESSPCENMGTCVDIVNGFQCQCAEGYTGAICSSWTNECESSPCQHNSTCLMDFAQYTCDCQPGFTGTHCEIDIDDCLSSPCQNGGTCGDGQHDYICQCQTGFSGGDCKINNDDCVSAYCYNGGTCMDDVNDFYCQCSTGYNGTYCRHNIDECLSNPCQNNGTCVQNMPATGYNCHCQPGYHGDKCEQETNECASNPCSSGSTCVNNVNHFICQCRAGFSGDTCQYIPIDGQWGGWGAWGNCSMDCGQGVQTRIRRCNNPTPQHDGLYCVGEHSDVKLCTEEPCMNQDGNWGQWGKWGRCSATCDEGITTRRRLCNNPAPTGSGLECVGTNVSTTPCMDITCGTPVDGGWSTWGEWSECSATCGLGTRRRHRACTHPPPVYGGAPCQGGGTDASPCMTKECPVDVYCDAWVSWSPCSRSCGDGKRKRKRRCWYMEGPDEEVDTSRREDVVEWEHEHCQNMACYEMECYTCDRNVSASTKELRCWGPRMTCPPDKPLCSHTLSREDDTKGRIIKGCSSVAECSKNQTNACENLRRQTVDSIITTEEIWDGALEPHADSLMRMWLSQEGECQICCRHAFCNMGLLPSGNTLYTARAASLEPLSATTAIVIIMVLMILPPEILLHK